jgi:hypothetical protein
MLRFDEVSASTWRLLELIGASPELLAECLLTLDGSSPMQGQDGQARRLERLIRDLDLMAQYEERVRLLEMLAAVRPLPEIDWLFLAEAILAIREGARAADDHGWTDAVEEAFSG